VDARTRYTRSFRHASGMITTAVASYPLHFRDEVGQWQAIRYELGFRDDHGGQFGYPIDEPRYAIDIQAGAWQLLGPAGQAWLSARPARLAQYSTAGELLGQDEPSAAAWKARVEEGCAAAALFPDVDFSIGFNPHYLKTSYLLHHARSIRPEAGQWVIEEEVSLPSGYTLSLAAPATGESPPWGCPYAVIARPSDG